MKDVRYGEISKRPTDWKIYYIVSFLSNYSWAVIIVQGSPETNIEVPGEIIFQVQFNIRTPSSAFSKTRVYENAVEKIQVADIKEV